MQDSETTAELYPLEKLTQKLGMIFYRPDRTLNTLLDLVWVPVMQRFFGGNDRAQKRAISVTRHPIRT